jgi:hypothetical protein
MCKQKVIYLPMLKGSDLYKQTVESLTISLVHLEKKTIKSLRKTTTL